MLRPTRLTDAQGPISCTRQSWPRSRCSAASDPASSVLACGSSVTVTLVSDVETRSTDMPWSLKTWNASARKPTWCHMPGLSSDTSVTPFFTQTAFTCAESLTGTAVSSVPSSSGAWVANTYSGIWYWRAGRMQRGCSTLAPAVAISCASS